MLLNIAKYGKIIMTQFQFTGTGAEPENNGKCRPFINVQYCTLLGAPCKNSRAMLNRS